MSKNTPKYLYALLGLLFVFNSCKKDYETIESIDDAKIQAYIKSNNIPAQKDPSGFYFQVLDPGTGSTLENKDSVFYSLNVKSITGQSYYTTADFKSEINLLGYISPSSYRTALYNVKRGGKVRVILPSYLAYGKNGSGVIPSNEIIVSDLTVAPEEKQWQIDDKLIRAFLAAKSITAVKHPSRVYYSISQAGTGTDVITPLSTITVKYTGRFVDGTKFDENISDTGYESILKQNIKGWIDVLTGMTKGTKLRILIPSDLAYGTRTDKTGIPPNSILDFDIEILTVVN